MTPLDPAAFRWRFPIFAQKVYVNSCSQGALSTDVADALDQFVHSWNAHGSPWEAWVEEVERLRGVFAAAIGGEADEVAVLPSASAGINAIASALAFDGPRCRVVMGEFEFPTMAQIWLAQQRAGAAIVWARAEGDTLPLSAYARVVDDRTLMVPATHICFRNGFKTDIAGLVRLCHERGAYVFLDDYQRLGAGPIDVHALGVDFMVGGCLKYLIGASGVAFLYVRRALIEALEPRITGWFGRVDPFAFSIDLLDWSPSARRFESGTPPIPNVYAALAGLALLQSVGFEAIEGRIAMLVARLIAGAAATGFVVATPPDPARRGPLVVLRSRDAAEVVRRLASRGIIASSRGTGVRISFHAYNSEQDVDRVLEGLAAEASLMEREPRSVEAMLSPES